MGLLARLFGVDKASVAKKCIHLYGEARERRPGKAERDYLKIVLLTKPPFDYARDLVIDRILDENSDISSLAAFVAESGPKGRHAIFWKHRQQNLVVGKEQLRRRNEEFFREAKRTVQEPDMA